MNLSIWVILWDDSGCFRRGNDNKPMQAIPQEEGGCVKHYEYVLGIDMTLSNT